MAGFKFAPLDQAIDAEIMHAKHVSGLLHGIGQPLDWWRWQAGVLRLFFNVWNGFHTSLRVVVVHGETNQFFGLLTPVNFGKQIAWADAERGGDATQLNQINPQGTVFDFRNGAARGIIPTRELQLVRKHVLRPTASVAAPSADQPPYEIPLLHFLMRFRLSRSILEHNFAFVLTEFRQASCGGTATTFAWRTADVQLHFHTGVYSGLRHELCAMGYTTFFCGFSISRRIFTSIRTHMLSCFHYNFQGFKTDLPKHGKAIQWEVGVIKLTANRRQFSPISLN